MIIEQLQKWSQDTMLQKLAASEEGKLLLRFIEDECEESTRITLSTFNAEGAFYGQGRMAALREIISLLKACANPAPNGNVPAESAHSYVKAHPQGHESFDRFAPFHYKKDTR